MIYAVTVDYMTSATVLIDAESAGDAEEKVYQGLENVQGMDEMLKLMHRNPSRSPDAFDVACVEPASQGDFTRRTLEWWPNGKQPAM